MRITLFSTLCIFSVFPDRPKGYIQRVVLGTAAFLLFGVGLLRLGAMANDDRYRADLRGDPEHAVERRSASSPARSHAR